MAIARRRRLNVARLFATICALAFWQGGLTFYAVVVVPVGNSILVGGEQGFVTQQVTNWMNLAGIPAIAILIVSAVHLRSRLFWAVCAVLAISLLGLLAIHWQMDQLLEPDTYGIIDRQRFGHWHEAYLTVITVQWCAALTALWLLLTLRPARRRAVSGWN